MFSNGKILILFICILCFLKNTCFSSECEYQIIDFGTLNAYSSEAISINDKGEVLGKYVFGLTHTYFIWSESEGLKPLNFPASVRCAVPKKLNNSGQVAGSLYYKNQADKRGFVLDMDGKLTIFEKHFTEIGSETQEVMDINDCGHVVGFICFSSVNNKAKTIPFVWNGEKIIPLLLSYSKRESQQASGFAFSINNQGVIVGKVHIHSNSPPSTRHHAVAWEHPNALFTDLHPVGFPEIPSKAFYVNNNNQILGVIRGVCRIWNKSVSYKISNYVYNKTLIKINDLEDHLYDTSFSSKNSTKYLLLKTINNLISKNSEFEKVEKFIDFNNNRQIIAEVKMVDGRHHGILIKIVE